jgi:hypothetical protein
MPAVFPTVRPVCDVNFSERKLVDFMHKQGQSEQSAKWTLSFVFALCHGFAPVMLSYFH